MSEESLPSMQPYLLRAWHEWCTDNGLTPYLAVKVDGSVQVPPEFVRNGEIVLNVSYDATGKLQLGNEYVEFQARFGGVPRQIIVPVHRVMAIYARENGQGMAFTVSDPVLEDEDAPARPAGAAAAQPVLTALSGQGDAQRGDSVSGPDGGHGHEDAAENPQSGKAGDTAESGAGKPAPGRPSLRRIK